MKHARMIGATDRLATSRQRWPAIERASHEHAAADVRCLRALARATASQARLARQERRGAFTRSRCPPAMAESDFRGDSRLARHTREQGADRTGRADRLEPREGQIAWVARRRRRSWFTGARHRSRDSRRRDRLLAGETTHGSRLTSPTIDRPLRLTGGERRSSRVEPHRRQRQRRARINVGSVAARGRALGAYHRRRGTRDDRPRDAWRFRSAWSIARRRACEWHFPRLVALPEHRGPARRRRRGRGLVDPYRSHHRRRGPGHERCCRWSGGRAGGPPKRHRRSRRWCRGGGNRGDGPGQGHARIRPAGRRVQRRLCRRHRGPTGHGDRTSHAGRGLFVAIPFRGSRLELGRRSHALRRQNSWWRRVAHGRHGTGRGRWLWRRHPPCGRCVTRFAGPGDRSRCRLRPRRDDVAHRKW